MHHVLFIYINCSTKSEYWLLRSVFLLLQILVSDSRGAKLGALLHLVSDSFCFGRRPLWFCRVLTGSRRFKVFQCNEGPYVAARRNGWYMRKHRQASYHWAFSLNTAACCLGVLSMSRLAFLNVFIVAWFIISTTGSITASQWGITRSISGFAVLLLLLL